MQTDIYYAIKAIAGKYEEQLHRQLEQRRQEMQADDKSHFLIYRALGIPQQEGLQIDLYQNKGRFLYKYAGAFMEEAVVCCLRQAYPNAVCHVKLPNPAAGSPRTFEIDCLVGERAYEIKWRDATTDGDHVRKEHSRVLTVKQAGYIPVRLMFFRPQRSQAQELQLQLEQLYRTLGGEYYSGIDAWNHLLKVTGIDLLSIIRTIADEHGFL